MAPRAFNLDGLVVYPGRGGEEVAYTQLFRTGAFEAARWVGMLTAEDQPDKTAIASGTVSGFMRDALLKFFAAAARWKISRPAIAAAALLDVGGWHLRHFVPNGWLRRERADRPNLICLKCGWIKLVLSTTLTQLLSGRSRYSLAGVRVRTVRVFDGQGNWIMY